MQSGDVLSISGRPGRNIHAWNIYAPSFFWRGTTLPIKHPLPISQQTMAYVSQPNMSYRHGGQTRRAPRSFRVDHYARRTERFQPGHGPYDSPSPSNVSGMVPKCPYITDFQSNLVRGERCWLQTFRTGEPCYHVEGPFQRCLAVLPPIWVPLAHHLYRWLQYG